MPDLDTYIFECLISGGVCGPSWSAWSFWAREGLGQTSFSSESVVPKKKTNETSSPLNSWQGHHHWAHEWPCWTLRSRWRIPSERDRFEVAPQPIEEDDGDDYGYGDVGDDGDDGDDGDAGDDDGDTKEDETVGAAWKE